MIGDVTNKNNGVKVIKGTVMDKSDRLNAWIYKLIATTFRDPPTIKAKPKFWPNSGISITKRRGSKTGKEKNNTAQEIM
ncbi:hypothetical protein LYNGBM3L_04700 [Moorena producens 3L]|uniref:Uncharacterized protein n=1 Tax=Moorena producens 3L TaxID=489825 RepID=F4XJ12_9CYAN|nr:hypothetical protein LYNGBM3L_04700 [Moorena producens 3L]